MLRSLYSGISGMKNMQTKLDVIGNNIANVNTYGFKKGRVTFKDAISQTISQASSPTASVGGRNNQQVGLGVETASIDTVFTEGSLQTTGRVLDLAVTGGDGYFVVRNGSNNYYTRAGNFYLDEQGYLVNSDGNFVLAYDSFDNLLSNIQVPKNIPSNTFNLIGNLNNKSDFDISYTQIVYDNKLNEHRLKFDFTNSDDDSNIWHVSIKDNDTNDELGSFSVAFDSTTGTFRNYIINGVNSNAASLNLTLDDGRGSTVDVVLDLDFTNVTSVNGEEDIEVIGRGSNKLHLTGPLLVEDTDYPKIDTVIKDGQITANITIEFLNDPEPVVEDAITTWNVSVTGLDEPLLLVFDNVTGKLMSINGSNENLDNYTITINDPNGTDDTATFRVNFTGLISTNERDFIFDPDVAELQEYSIGGNGDFIVQYSDGSVRTIASLALARFNNPEGLTKIGGNLFNVSENSGAPVFGNGGPGFGSIESGKLEMSNVDLTEEFTEMIVAQRAFQSNSRIITTSDEILQEIVNLKR